MQNLLVQNTFDSFLVTEGEINVFSSFSFDGHINKDYFSPNEIPSSDEDFITWNRIKKVCFDMIYGQNAPTRIKLVLALPKSQYADAINKSGANLTPDNISGLFLHILYENNEINIITGASLNIFTMDKTLDKYWDKIMYDFLEKNFLIEQL